MCDGMMKKMTAKAYSLGTFRVVGIVALLTAPIILMFLIWRDSVSAPFVVVSGKLFQNKWHIIHAGFVMDQPTIGKWYFWFTVFSILWLLFAFLASNICDTKHRILPCLYAPLSLVAVCILLCVLAVPFFGTVQYIQLMGFTPHRLIAFGYGLSAFIIMPTLFGLLIRRTSKKN
jgi:hypothetical protein